MNCLKTPLLRVAACAVVALGIVSMNAGEAKAFPWSTDMMNHQSIKPQEKTTPFPKRSVPVSGIPSAEWEDRDATEELINPISATPDSLKKGKMLYKIYCAACHGMTGRAESEVAKRGMPATDLTDDGAQVDITEGWIFGTITFGSGIMPPYGRAGDQDGEARGSNDLSVEERWHVVNYIKHQLVADAVAAGPLPE